MSAAKTHVLVRGLHLIPDEVESAAGLSLVFSHPRAARALERVIKAIESHKSVDEMERALLIRRLRTVETFVTSAGNFVSGGFEVPTTVPIVKLTWDEGASRHWETKRQLEQSEHLRQRELHRRRSLAVVPT